MSQKDIWKCFNKGTKAGMKIYWQENIADKKEYCNIANQIDLKNHPDTKKKILTDPMTQCKFLREEQGVILWNGDLVPCCYDYDGIGVYGNVLDPDFSLDIVPKVFRICKQCPGHISEGY